MGARAKPTCLFMQINYVLYRIKLPFLLTSERSSFVMFPGRGEQVQEGGFQQALPVKVLLNELVDELELVSGGILGGSSVIR